MVEVRVLFAAVPASDLAAATAWYTRLFGRRPDIVPNDDEVMWRLADAAWCYVIRDPERAGRTVVTMCVADLAQTLAELASRGIDGGPVEMVAEAARKTVIHDPDGNSISLIEVADGRD